MLAYKQAEVTINQLQKEDKLIQNVLGNTKVVDTLLKGILDAKSQEMITDPNNPGAQIKKYPNTTEGQQKMYQDAIVELRQVIMTAGQPKKKLKVVE